MSRRVTRYVHVVERDDNGELTGRTGVFGPADELPDWAQRSITHDGVWTDDEQSAAGGHRTAPRRGNRRGK